MQSYYKSKVLKELLQQTEYILPAVEGGVMCEECWKTIEIATLSIGYHWFCCNECMIEWEFLRCGCQIWLVQEAFDTFLVHELRVLMTFQAKSHQTP